MTEKESVQMRGIVGLANLGNTCYQNAVLQAFRHCPEWTLFCSKGHVDEFIEKDSKSTPVLEAYRDVVKSLWAGTGPAYILPRGFFEQIRKSVLNTMYESFGQRSPQDAHEFLVWLLDQMYMATQRKLDLGPHSNETIFQKANTAWKKSFENQHSPLTDLIFGLLHIEYHCHNCKAVHLNWETFNVLKCTPCQGKTLKECIEEELKPEEIEGFKCETCKETTTITKTQRIWKLPKVLIVTMKRFDWQGRKLVIPIQYDNEPLEFETIFSKNSLESSKEKPYKLFATVDHHGGSLGGGHYTAQCYNSVWKKWHLYDDDSAHEIKAPMFGGHSYILFFRQSVKN